MRPSVAVLFLRLLVFGSGVAALVVAVPSELRWPLGWIAAGIAAAYAASRPGSHAPLTVGLLALAGWLIGTTWFETPMTWLGLVGIAAAVYVHHASAALAAVVPLDTALSLTAAAQWLARCAGVVGVTAALGWLALAFPRWVGDTPPALVLVPVAGLAVTVLIVAIPVRLIRRSG